MNARTIRMSNDRNYAISVEHIRVIIIITILGIACRPRIDEDHFMGRLA
jgi:hypothetical protein